MILHLILDKRPRSNWMFLETRENYTYEANVIVSPKFIGETRLEEITVGVN